MRRKILILLVISALLATLAQLVYTNKGFLADLYGYSKASFSQYGSTGQEVITIQTKLSRWGYYSGTIDGRYGYLTYQAVKLFQSKNGLTVDGIAGPVTLGAMGIMTSTTSGTPIYTDANVNLLAHLIHAESRAEPYVGQVAVGAVVINRTKDSRFPQTIPGVVYQPGAFTPVSDGQINLTPNTSAFNAARDALNGWDPTGGCLFYYNPATATSPWIWSRPIIITIGNHNFCK